MRLFIIGYAGSGKSTIARRLTHDTGIRSVDTDKLVEQRVGASIADIFLYEGEEYFREAERSAIESIAAEGDVIVATGGGLPTWRDNMEWMNDEGVTIYLRRTAEQILKRLSDYGRQKRPMFRGKSDEELLEFMTQQMADRERYYAKAQYIIDCSVMSDDDIVNYITQLITRL